MKLQILLRKKGKELSSTDICLIAVWYYLSHRVGHNWTDLAAAAAATRTDAKAETPILWPPHAKSWLIGKDSDAGRDWRQEEKGMTEDEMAGWHHWLDGRESEWTLGVSDGQGGLECCDSWGRKESDTTEQLNWTELMGLDTMIFVFWMLSFKPVFSLHSFTFIKSLFSSSSLSAIRVVSSA